MADAIRTAGVDEVSWVTPEVTITVQKSETHLIYEFRVPLAASCAPPTWQEFDSQVRSDCEAAGLTAVG